MTKEILEQIRTEVNETTLTKSKHNSINSLIDLAVLYHEKDLLEAEVKAWKEAKEFLKGGKND